MLLKAFKRSMAFCLAVAVLATTAAFALDDLQENQGKIVPYRVLRNRIQNGERHIDILLDEKDFTVDNLKSLMTHFWPAYREPERLWVFVATSTSQVYDFAEYSNPERAPGALHPYGGLHRERDKDFIRYRFPGEKFQTLVIKEKTKRTGK
jgi:hypothetical protein